LRAAFVSELVSQDQYTLTGDLLHHLVNVIRIEKNEELLLLDGKGFTVKTTVMEVTKKALILKRLSENKAERKTLMDVVIGIPKKEALELCLKEAVELGFRKIFLVRSAYSQTRIPETERMAALLVSALEQSNSAFLPEIIEGSWEELPWNDYGTVILLDSQEGKSGNSSKASSHNLLIIGPEGGFSPVELSVIRDRKNVESILLPTPILRTPTALATGAGILLQRLMT
jgi:16S rRNA (uracil1498-N3)-methyltransferase